MTGHHPQGSRRPTRTCQRAPGSGPRNQRRPEGQSRSSPRDANCPTAPGPIRSGIDRAPLRATRGPGLRHSRNGTGPHQQEVSMPWVFPRATNTIARMTFLGTLLGAALVLLGCLLFVQSSYGTGAGVVRVQPVPFSHQHHVGVLGIDCRYCHTSVEHSPFAGMPETKTCMNCHSQIWVGSQMLAPVRESFRTNQSIAWERVYNTPGFVYFAHHVHVQNGIGCSTCHGRIDRMPFTEQASSLLMQWCLDCHRNPAPHLRPREGIFNTEWQPPADQKKAGQRLLDEYKIAGAEQ